MSVGRCNTRAWWPHVLHLSTARDVGGATMGDQRLYRRDGRWGQCLVHALRIHERVRDVLGGGISHSHVTLAWRC